MKPQDRLRSPATRPRHTNTRRGAAAAALLVVAVALSACAPAAGWIRDRLDSGDAVLAYTTTGVRFDPLDRPAYQTHLAIRGDELSLNPAQPTPAVLDECATSADAKRIDCSLGTVTAPIEIAIHGKGWIGSATYTREPTGLAWLWAYTPTE